MCIMHIGKKLLVYIYVVHIFRAVYDCFTGLNTQLHSRIKNKRVCQHRENRTLQGVHKLVKKCTYKYCCTYNEHTRICTYI